MAHFVLIYYFIILLFYSNLFNTANPTTVNDSWLWPNEVESKIDEPPLNRPQRPISPSAFGVDMTMRQKRPKGIVYQDSPLLQVLGGQHNRRNSSAWKKFKTETGKQPSTGFIKTVTTDISGNLGSENDKKSPPLFTHGVNSTTPSSVQKDWTFPEDNLIKRKSELKCAEYNKAIENKDVWIHPLVGNWPATLSPKKTSPNNKCKGIQNPLIIGGIVAKLGEFSHMAALGWISQKNEATFLCGGTIISNQWVITAAHCTHGPSGPPKVVRVGARHLGDESAGKLITVQEIIRHPSYKPPKVYADLALLKLDKSVNFGLLIKPACLYTEFDTTPNQAWATGWGLTGIGEEPSDELLKVRLDIVDNVDCALKLNRSSAIPRGIVPSMLCAGDIGGDWQGDTCQGDSGGPLQILHPKNKCLYQIIGVTSFGRLCALRNSPGVYTRVSHYIDWIESIVWPDNN